LGDYLAAARSAAAGRRSRPGFSAGSGAAGRVLWRFSGLDVATAEAKPPPSFLLPRGLAQPGRAACAAELGEAARRGDGRSAWPISLAEAKPRPGGPPARRFTAWRP
jgi:hypothetical protein